MRSVSFIKGLQTTTLLHSRRGRNKNKGRSCLMLDGIPKAATEDGKGVAMDMPKDGGGNQSNWSKRKCQNLCSVLTKLYLHKTEIITTVKGVQVGRFSAGRSEEQATEQATFSI
ncbi:hypothetical protein Ancab_009019 [Ancistrocladus abbreviatus]